MRLRFFAPALVFFITSAAWASAESAESGSAQQFLEQQYATRMPPFPRQHELDDAHLLTPSLNALLARDDKLAGDVGEVPYLDGDLLCSCQDGDISHLHITTHTADADHATAHIRFQLSGASRDFHMMLQRIAGQWRIDNIVSASDGSLRRGIADDIALREKDQSASGEKPAK
jgi:hypothetical protein